jgi:hypothetical protein
MRVLQTLAFPLGHVALNKTNYSGRVFLCQLIELFYKKMPFGILERAMGLEPINLFLGKEAFYQLNYARMQPRLYSKIENVVNLNEESEKIYSFTTIIGGN